MEFWIWALLAGLSVWVAHMIIERVAYLIDPRHRPGDPVAVENALIGLRTGNIQGTHAGAFAADALGWLGKLLDAANLDDLARAVHRERMMADRFVDQLRMAHDLAMTIGLLGCVTVLIARAKLGAATATDPITSLSLALGTTQFGLFIAIPSIFVVPFVGLHASRRLDQIHLVLDELYAIRRDRIAARPAAAHPVEAPPHTNGAALASQITTPRPSAKAKKARRPEAIELKIIEETASDVLSNPQPDLTYALRDPDRDAGYLRIEPALRRRPE